MVYNPNQKPDLKSKPIFKVIRHSSKERGSRKSSISGGSFEN